MKEQTNCENNGPGKLKKTILSKKKKKNLINLLNTILRQRGSNVNLI